jgi:hypothetical protein
MKRWVLLSVMFRRITLVFLLAFSVLSGYNCRRDELSSTTVLTGKLLSTGDCYHIVVQVVGGPIVQSGLQIQSWTDPQTNIHYSNIFAVQDMCVFSAAKIPPGGTFTFSVGDTVSPQPCVSCNYVLAEMPTVFDPVKDIILVTD